jgi:hypothetical protein
MTLLLVSYREEDLRRLRGLRSRFFMAQTRKEPKRNDAPKAHEPGMAKDVGQATDLPQHRLSDLLMKALSVFEQKLIDDESFRLTLAGYIKLLQVERDLQLETDIHGDRG